MALSCGIDFGTSNSALATAKDGKIELASLEGAHKTLPSAVFYPVGAQPLFGRSAMQAFMRGDEGRFMRSLKRMLGTALMGQGTLVNGRKKDFDMILRDFISHIKTKAEAECGTALDNVVMGRPVHFVDHDTAADARAQSELEKIAKSAGFKNVEFQYEPIAAAFAHEQHLTSEKLALVVDIGGGTSDFTVIRLSPNHKNATARASDILASSGVRIGGNDFDKDLALSSFMPALGYKTTHGDKNMILPAHPFHELAQWSKVNFLYTAKTRLELQGLYKHAHDQHKFGRFLKIIEDETGHQFLSMVEDTKIALTDHSDTQCSLSFIETDLKIKIQQKNFNKAVAELVNTISSSVTECLQKAGVSDDTIELIILTGGTTEVPVLKNTIQKRFLNVAISEENKLSSVGLGLGYDSARRFV
jgi:hypothetical chaperone protein